AKRPEATALALSLESDPERKVELRRRIQEQHASLEAHLEERARRLEGGKPDPDRAFELREVLLDQARARLAHARSPGVPEDRKRRLLEEAVDLLQDIELASCDSIAVHEAAWLEGQCHLERGDLKTARSRLA